MIYLKFSEWFPAVLEEDDRIRYASTQDKLS